MASKKSPYDYEPKTIHGLDGWNNDDPVKLNMTDGTKDPVNDGVEDHLGEPYVPKHGA